jgi:hypothetical protein
MAGEEVAGAVYAGEEGQGGEVARAQLEVGAN